MAKSIREVLSYRYELLSDSAARLEVQLMNFPNGSLNVKRQGSRCYYYHIDNTRTIYLSVDNELIGKLAQKAYLKQVLHSLKCEMELLEDTIKHYPVFTAEEVYDILPEARRKYTTPVVLGGIDSVEKWINAPYDHKGFSKNAPVYITLKGERVRSKSEMIIADRLWANGIPYKYECPILVDGEIIHPDFTILRLSDMKVLYHEHCGMIDVQDYAEKLASRINAYNNEGIYLGDRLFLTMETSNTPLDVRVIDNLIKTHFI